MVSNTNKYNDSKDHNDNDQGCSQTFLITEAVAKLRAFKAVWGHAPPENVKFRGSQMPFFTW